MERRPRKYDSEGFRRLSSDGRLSIHPSDPMYDFPQEVIDASLGIPPPDTTELVTVVICIPEDCPTPTANRASCIMHRAFSTVPLS